jgi:hypothetical protein
LVTAIIVLVTVLIKKLGDAVKDRHSTKPEPIAATPATNTESAFLRWLDRQLYIFNLGLRPVVFLIIYFTCVAVFFFEPPHPATSHDVAWWGVMILFFITNRRNVYDAS